MKTIDSQSLGPLQKALGLAGRGAGATELLDGTVNQVLDVTRVASRGRTVAGTEGVFRGVMRVIAAAPGVVSTGFFPYNSNPTTVIAPFPTPIPDTFDLWLLGASVERVSGTGSFSIAAIRMSNIQQAFGIDSVGAAVISTSVMTLAFWDGIVTTVPPPFGTQNFITAPWQNIGIRIPRKGPISSPGLSFGVNVTGAAATFDLVMLLGLFPIALGQDVVV